MTSVQTYQINHRASGIEVGDTVRVTRRAAAYSGGWANTWPPDMDNSVNLVYRVARDGGSQGFGLSNGYDYPYFVLEKINTP